MSKLNALNDFKNRQEVLVNLSGEGYVLRKVVSLNYADNKLLIDMGSYNTEVTPESCHKPPKTMLIIEPVRG